MPGHDPRAGRHAVVLVDAGERRELEEGRAAVDHAIDAVAHHDLAALEMALDRALATGSAVERRPLAFTKRLEQPRIGVAIRREARRAGSMRDSMRLMRAPSRSFATTAARTSRRPSGRAPARPVA